MGVREGSKEIATGTKKELPGENWSTTGLH